MTAELQRPTPGDGTRQAGGPLVRANAGHSWGTGCAAQLAAVPRQATTERAVSDRKGLLGIRGSQKKMGAGCDAHAISFLCFMIHFLEGIERRPYREAFFYGSRRGLYFGSGGRAWT